MGWPNKIAITAASNKKQVCNNNLFFSSFAPRRKRLPVFAQTFFSNNAGYFVQQK